VDVWAQNKSSFTHPRVTYPEYGGGGTNTGVALARLSDTGLSVGVFAPAWSFEHFPGHERDVERTVWEGTPLPGDIECTCGDCTSRHPPNKEHPILHAKERVAGSEHFFHMDFTRAFSPHDDDAKYLFNNSNIHSQLGSQSVLPRPASLFPESEHITLSHHIEHSHNQNVLVISFIQKQPTDDWGVQAWLPLYKLDMPADGSLQLSMVLDSDEDSRTPEMECMTVFVYFKTDKAMHYRSCMPMSREPIVLVDDLGGARIQELGIRIRGPLRGTVRGPVRLMGITEICISPTSDLAENSSLRIKEVRVEKRGEGESRHVRLCWDYEDAANYESKTAGMPWSDVTGPFAHFTIRSKGLLLAKAYALEHILNEKFVERYTGQKIEIEVTGIGFDGRTLAEMKVTLEL